MIRHCLRSFSRDRKRATPSSVSASRRARAMACTCRRGQRLPLSASGEFRPDATVTHNGRFVL